MRSVVRESAAEIACCDQARLQTRLLLSHRVALTATRLDDVN
jgi:hypothetical protein